MQPEVSLPHSQLPATCPYPQPASTSPNPHIPLPKDLSLSTPGPPKWPLSLTFPYQNTVYASPLSHTHYIPSPSHSSPFYHPNSIGYMNLEIRKRKFRWIGHTLRKEEGEVPKAALLWNPQGNRKKRRLKNSWRRSVIKEAGRRWN